LARALLGSEKIHDASVAAHEAYYGALESLGAIGDRETMVCLAFAECLLAASDMEAARSVLLRARERLQARATSLGPRCDRNAFCSNVPYNSQTLRLADANLGTVRPAIAEKLGTR
jgi:thioredoxin-like negative regulator of GroEL